MKYIIKNKIFSWGAGSTVRDEAGNDLYVVKGSVFTLTKKKFIRDTSGNTLYMVRNKFFHFILPKAYVCDAQGNRLMQIRKRKAFSFKANLSVIPEPGQDFDFSIDGDYIARHFDIFEHGNAVAHVRRNFNLIKDSFWLETERADLAPLLIAFVIAIDNMIDNAQNESR